MAGTPPEYYIRYRLTDTANTNAGAEGIVPAMVRSRFAVSGNTNVPVGKITRIVYTHWHTSTRTPTWKLFGRLKLADGSSIDSNTVSHKFSSDIYKYTNTFTENLPGPEAVTTWASIQTRAAAKPSSGDLYYRANKDYPLDVTFYFWSAADLVDGAEPPTVSGVTVQDAKDYITTFGDVIQGQSDLTITGQYELDPNYPYLTAAHTLQIMDSSGENLYQATQDENAVFQVGEILAAGTISWIYTVLDSAGNRVSATGTITVLAYSPPTLTGLIAERYITTLDDHGDPAYVAADDGENVRFSFMAVTASVASANAWRLVMTYGQDGSDENGGTAVTVDTGTDGETVTATQDRDILSATVGADTGWWFKFQLSDSFTETSMTVYIDEATAFFNVEKQGVAVGMLSKGSAGDKRFEVADPYESHFYGGIYGVTNYYENEHPTGGRWINGKPLYRRTLVISVTTAGVNAYGAIDEEVEIVFEISGTLVTDNNGTQYPINCFYSSSIYCVCWRYEDDAQISVRASHTGTAYVTILYTRTDDPLRTFWVYSADEGRLILKEQVAGSVVASSSNDVVTVSAVAGEDVSYDSTTGRITIGHTEEEE